MIDDDEEEDRKFREHFSGLRNGLKSFVVDLSERVHIQLDGFDKSGRHGDPSWGEISQGVFTHFSNMLTGLFRQTDDPPHDDSPNDRSESKTPKSQDER